MKTNRFLSLIVMMVLTSLTVVYSTDIDDAKTKETLKQYNVVDPSIFVNETIVTRNDCVALIMRSIGVPDNIFLESYIGTQTFYDFESTDKMLEYFQECKFVSGTNYVAVAKEYTNIIFGEKNQQEEFSTEGAIYFNFVRAVTTKETLAFMVRCLKNTDMDLANIDVTFAKAKELGLIKETDAFYENPDNAISSDDLFILLHRFLYQPRYLYFGGKDNGDFNVDSEGNMTYIEYLNQRKVVNE